MPFIFGVTITLPDYWPTTTHELGLMIFAACLGMLVMLLITVLAHKGSKVGTWSVVPFIFLIIILVLDVNFIH